MIEAAILLLIIFAAVAAGLAVWRAVAGRAKHIAARAAALTLVAALLVLISAWEIGKARTFQFFGEIIPRVETEAKVVALTFDDGPTPRFTDEILAILRERQVKATFFLIGSDLERNMDEGRKIVDQGHEVGNHSYSHQRMLIKPLSFIREEIEKTDSLIRQTGYAGDIHFRSPYGKKLLLLPYYLSRTGRKNIFFDVEPDSIDDVAVDARKITDHVLANARPGSIILLHVMYASRAESMKAVPGIIDGLREKGYSFKTVSEMLEMERGAQK